MESSTRQRLVWLCVAASLLLAVAQGAVWKHQHDEGTTFDLAVGFIDEGNFIPDAKELPAPVTALYRTVEGRTDYSLMDAINSVTMPDFRLFHPPGYYALLHLWTKVFGTSRLVLRLPAYLLAALALLGMVRIARRVIPEQNGGLWVALLFGLSPWVLRITNFARPYHLALFCAVWATVAVLELQGERHRHRWRAFFVAISLLGIYSLYHYGIVLVWHLALLGWQAWSARPERRRGELFALGAMLLGLLAGYAPWLRNFSLHMQITDNSDDYFAGAVAAEHWSDCALQAFQDFAIGDSQTAIWGPLLGTTSIVLGVITLAVMLWAFAGPARKALDAGTRRFWISATLMPLMVLATDLWRDTHTLFITKLCFGMMVLLMPLLVRSWLAIPWAWLRTAGLTSWALLFLAAGIFSTYTRAYHTSGMEEAAAAIAQADSSDHLVIVNTDLRGYSVPFLLSLKEAGVGNVFVVRAKTHQLTDLMVSISNNWFSRFQRVSLVNFMVPWSPRGVTWPQAFLRGEIVDNARASCIWSVFWDSEQPWMREPSMATLDRPPETGRELWLIGPVHTCFFGNTANFETSGESE